MDIIALVMYALFFGLVIGAAVGMSWRIVWNAIGPSGKPVPEGVNNALTNLHIIASGRDPVTGHMIASGEMMELAKDALEAVYKEYQ